MNTEPQEGVRVGSEAQGRPSLVCTPLLPLWPSFGLSLRGQTYLHHALGREVRIPASTSAFGIFS